MVIINRVCPKIPTPVIARRFLRWRSGHVLPKQSPYKPTEIASSHKTLLALTLPDAFTERH